MKANLACITLVMFILAGCGAIDEDESQANSGFSRDSRLLAPEHLTDVSFSIVKTARVKTLDALFVSGGSWTETRIGAHSAIFVRHPQGNFLFDSGLGDHIDEQFRVSMPFWLKPLMSYDKLKSARATLADNPEHNRIRMIILSHLHWDHAGGIKDFPAAEIWTTQAEYEMAMDPHTPERAFIKSQYQGPAIKWKFIRFNDTHYENFSRSLDVYHDGSIVLVPLPGHTPGAIGMFVNLRSGKRFFFTGDTTWALEGFKKPAHKFWIASLIVDDNKAVTEQSILKVHRLMREYPDMTIVPAHDNTVQSSIGFYPEFIH